MSSRTIRTDYAVTIGAYANARAILRTFNTPADAQAYVRSVRSGGFLTTADAANLTITSRQANR